MFGTILGTILGTLAYRSAYASILDARYNHIPLPPFKIKTRLSFSGNAGQRCIYSLSEKHLEEADTMIAWRWWKRSGPTDPARFKEILRLQNLHRANFRENSDEKAVNEDPKTPGRYWYNGAIGAERRKENTFESDEHFLSCHSNHPNLPYHIPDRRAGYDQGGILSRSSHI